MTWVKGKGGVRRWIGPLPEDRLELQSSPRRHDPPAGQVCGECGVPAHGTLCRPCRNVAESLVNGLPFPPLRPLSAPCCADCGCLLKSVRERCPSCLVWCERKAITASWEHAVDHYQPAASIERNAA